MIKLKHVVLAASVFFSAAASTPALALDKVSFGTNWRAQGSHGGYYQAVADGTYARYGLEVDIQQGGPQVNNRPLLSAGKLDFLMGGNLLQAFDNIKNRVPTVWVAAMFQKDPQGLMAHADAGYKNFNDLTRAKTILIGKDMQFAGWQWMKKTHGFRDEQLRPYNYSLAQFLADKAVVQQVFVNAEPIYAEAAGVKPQVFLLADAGWSTYANGIETRADMTKNKPDVVRRFVEASIIGWYNFMYGDHTAAYALIKKANPEMTDEKIDREVAKIREIGLLDSGDALEKGIGTMSQARINDFYEKMVKSGLHKQQDVDLNLVIDTRFVNKGLGLDLKKKLSKQ